MTLLFLACALTAQQAVDDKVPGDSAVDTADTDSGETDTADTGCTDPVIWFADADNDGYGTPIYTTEACDQPAGHVGNSDDCNDTEVLVAPGIPEVCDSVDQDCDDLIDEESTDALTWFADTDVDGYGDAANTTLACAAPDGFTGDSADCDDTSPDVYPGADEYCNGEDDDCDTVIDETDALDALTWYADTDGDGFGDPNNTTPACELPDFYLADDNDCDDSRADANPLADEVCNGLDDDCDVLVDDNPTNPATWYFDADGDGYGRATTFVSACDQPPSYAATGDDCDDVNGEIHPNAADYCDTTDTDCDGDSAEDNSVDAPLWYVDSDADGFGNLAISKTACSLPTGHVADSTDCDDSTADVSPASTEYCGGGDENCDGSVDESTAADADAWYADVDLDGYGDPLNVTMSCTVVAGSVADASDCGDSDDTVNPLGVEVCADGIDQDCNGEIDDTCWPAGTIDLADADLVVQGAYEYSYVGFDLAGGLDLTGDDVVDFVVSTTIHGSGSGGYYVVDGALSGTISATSATAGLKTTGWTPSDLAVGDADGDGQADVLAVASENAWLDLGPFSSGSSATGSRASFDLKQNLAWAQGSTFSDLDGDGTDELLLGTLSGGYTVSVYENPVGSQDYASAPVIWTENSSGPFGYAIDGGEDVDGDGLDDVLIASSPQAPGAGAYVVFGPGGSSGTIESVADITFEYAYVYYAKHSAALLPDADGDGLADVLLGCENYPPDVYSNSLGAAWLLTGLTAGIRDLTSADALITGSAGYQEVGTEVDGADIDGDGVTDLLIGSKFVDAWAYFGPVSGTLDTTDADNTFDTPPSSYGSIANAGDVEGFGFDSVLVSVPLDDAAVTDAGAVYVFHGTGR